MAVIESIVLGALFTAAIALLKASFYWCMLHYSEELANTGIRKYDAEKIAWVGSKIK